MYVQSWPTPVIGYSLNEDQGFECRNAHAHTAAVIITLAVLYEARLLWRVTVKSVLDKMSKQDRSKPNVSYFSLVSSVCAVAASIYDFDFVEL